MTPRRRLLGWRPEPMLVGLVLLGLVGVALRHWMSGTEYQDVKETADNVGVPALVLVPLAWFGQHAPEAIVPLAACGLLVYFFWNRVGVEPRSHGSQNDPNVALWLTTLQKADPDFDLTRVLANARTLLLRVEQARCASETGALRPLLSDRAYASLRAEVEAANRCVRCDVEVDSAQVVGLEETPTHQLLRVCLRGRVHVAQVPSTTPAEEAMRLARAQPIQPFEETWTFLRHPQASSRTTGDAYRGECPSCGVELSPPEVTTCARCGAKLNTGLNGWVLDELTLIGTPRQARATS